MYVYHITCIVLFIPPTAHPPRALPSHCHHRPLAPPSPRNSQETQRNLTWGNSLLMRGKASFIFERNSRTCVMGQSHLLHCKRNLRLVICACRRRLVICACRCGWFGWAAAGGRMGTWVDGRVGWAGGWVRRTGGRGGRANTDKQTKKQIDK